MTTEAERKEELNPVGCYPDPICQDCGEECDRTEELYTGDEASKDGIELWCYCKPCDTETFHPIHG